MTNTFGIHRLMYRKMAATETETTSSSDCSNHETMASSRTSGSSIENCSTSRGTAHTTQNEKDPHPSSASPRPLYEAPPHTGLLITLQENDGEGSAGHSSSLLLTFVPDLSLKKIHPNAHGPAGPPIVPTMADTDATNSSSTDKSDNKEGNIPNSARVPASLSDVHLLMGGGSGATVFSGSINHYGLGHVVMKHGGPKETAEHVALATIEEELRKRGRKATQVSSDLEEVDSNDGMAAAEFFRTRIPTFSFLYISPWHCRDRGAELWSTLRNLFLMHKAMKGLGWWENLEGKDDLQVTTVVGGKKTERTVRVFSGEDAGTPMPEVEVSNGFVDLHLPGAELITPQTAMTPAIVRFGQSTEGYTNLYNLSKQLRALQEERLWKFTQGQSEIGGDSPRTASSLLTSCQLCADNGRLLHVLTDEFIQVIRNLQILTHPEELDAIQDVEEELMTLEGAASNDGTNSNPRIIAAVSKKTDMFVGLSIKKNYHPTKGRFVRMRETGDRFRHYFDEMQRRYEVGDGSQVADDPNDKRLVLTDEEKIPARFLAKLLEKGMLLREIFGADTVTENQRCALDVVTDDGHSSWLGLIRRAVSVQCDSARKCVWNAGLSDAGCKYHALFSGSIVQMLQLWHFAISFLLYFSPAFFPCPHFPFSPEQYIIYFSMIQSFGFLTSAHLLFNRSLLSSQSS